MICNRSKVHVDDRKFTKNTTLHKCGCLFEAITFTKDNIGVLQVRKVGYNHKLIFSGAYFTYKKAVIIEDVQQQIAYQA